MGLLNRMSAFVIAALMACTTAMTVFADYADDYDYGTDENAEAEYDEENDNEDEEDNSPEISDKYVTDASKFTLGSDEPTLSFDMSGWEDYIEIVDNSGVKFTTTVDNKSAYQGQSLLIKASGKGSVDDNTLAFNWECTDSSGAPLFESEPDPNKNYSTMGIVFSAEKFGLECFNGATLTFKYRLGADTKNLLMANTIIAAPVDENGNYISEAKVSKYTYNTAESNNVATYANAVVSVAELSDTNTTPASKLLLMLPVHAQADDVEIVEIDNVTLTLRSGATGANVDGYNKMAAANEGEVELQIKKEVNEVKLTEDKEPLSNKLRSAFGITMLVVIGLGVVVGIVFAIVKAKKRFY